MIFFHVLRPYVSIRSPLRTARWLRMLCPSFLHKNIWIFAYTHMIQNTKYMCAWVILTFHPCTLTSCSRQFIITEYTSHAILKSHILSIQAFLIQLFCFQLLSFHTFQVLRISPSKIFASKPLALLRSNSLATLASQCSSSLPCRSLASLA